MTVYLGKRPYLVQNRYSLVHFVCLFCYKEKREQPPDFPDFSICNCEVKMALRRFKKVTTFTVGDIFENISRWKKTDFKSNMFLWNMLQKELSLRQSDRWIHKFQWMKLFQDCAVKNNGKSRMPNFIFKWGGKSVTAKVTNHPYVTRM